MTENRRLLVVDDEPEALQGYVDFLTPEAGSGRKSSRGKAAADNAPAGEHYDILTASSGEEAVALFKKEMAEGREVAAGFFDVKMQGVIDGLQTIEQIKAIDPRIHCVVVTAYHDRTVEEIHKLFGEEFKDHWDYLNKPFTRGEIVQKARQMVAAWNRMRQIETMQKQLVLSERMAAIGQVARGIGHEFGNILQRVVGKIDLAQTDTKEEKVINHLKVAQQAMDRASIILRNLRSFSKSDAKLEFASLPKVFQFSLTLIQHELKRSDITVVEDFQPAPELMIDVAGVGQVFLNLLINAMHAMPQGGTITFSVQAHTGGSVANPVRGVLCRFRDTGTGIPKEVIPRIFDYGFTTKGEKGSGLGLSICGEIMAQHGGTITVDSEAEKGAEFQLWFPTP